MTVLLDTDVLLWFLFDDRRLGSVAHATIADSASLALSDASRWEISIKIVVGKMAPHADLPRAIRGLGIVPLGITDRYLARLETLPLHHRDPFDRMIVAQALTDDLTVLTADSMFEKYGVRVADARQ